MLITCNNCEDIFKKPEIRVSNHGILGLICSNCNAALGFINFLPYLNDVCIDQETHEFI